MKLSHKDREVIATSQKIQAAIGSKLKSNDKGTKVDLSDIAKSLASRRARVLREEEETEEKGGE